MQECYYQYIYIFSILIPLLPNIEIETNNYFNLIFLEHWN